MNAKSPDIKINDKVWDQLLAKNDEWSFTLFIDYGAKKQTNRIIFPNYEGVISHDFSI